MSMSEIKDTKETTNEYKLDKKWSFYIHLHNTDDWSYESYHKIAELTNLEQSILLINEINFELIKKSIIFVMKDNIKPMWEDDNNKNGGGFSFKVHNKNDIESIFKKLFYRLIGNTLTKPQDISNAINGISISPKKSFCIIKIWMNSCKFMNPNVFDGLEDLDKNGCLFKKHLEDR
jgi:hypothetical protein